MRAAAVFLSSTILPLLALLQAAPAAASAQAGRIDTRLEALRDQERAAYEMLDHDPDAAVRAWSRVADGYEELAASRPDDPTAFWRAARCRWFVGEILPVEKKRERLATYTAARELAGRGIEADPECAECMLWKFIAMGRVATTRSLVTGMRSASEMAALLERGLALEPTHRDGANNSTLGNLHYSSAIFYRVLPDWAWLGWMIGVRGDKERALAHARTALELHPGRLDYRVEVASQLLCLGTDGDQRARLEEGVRMLEELLEQRGSSLRDDRQYSAAEIMLESPPKSCGYTGVDWVEIDAHSARAAAESGD